MAVTETEKYLRERYDSIPSLEDIYNIRFELEARLFLRKHFRRYLKPLEEYPEMHKEVFVLIDVGYFVRAKVHPIKSPRTNSNWRTITSIDKIRSNSLYLDAIAGEDIWSSFNEDCALGWINIEEGSNLINRIKSDMKQSKYNVFNTKRVNVKWL